MFKKSLTALFVAGVLVLTGAGAASADPGSTVLTATDTSIAVGQTTTVTASPLEDGATAYFSTGANGVLTADEVVATGGQAQTVFSATAAGRYTVNLGDGETDYAFLEIVVTALPTDPGPTEVTASPRTITVGGTSTVTASPVENGFPGRFATTTGGTVTPTDVTGAGGQAVTTFSATAPGRYTVSFGDQVNPPIARVEILVVAAPADPGLPTLTASPARITVNQTSTITASPLEDGFPARFSTSGGGVITPGAVTASGGQAQAVFSAPRPGTYRINFGDGETDFAFIDVVVVAALPVTGADVPPALVLTGAGAVVLGAVAVVVATRRRTRRNH